MKKLLNRYVELQKFALPYAVLFMADIEEKILNAFEEKPMIWWRYIDNIFFIWEHGQEYLEKLLNKFSSDNKVYCSVLKRNN